MDGSHKDAISCSHSLDNPLQLCHILASLGLQERDSSCIEDEDALDNVKALDLRPTTEQLISETLFTNIGNVPTLESVLKLNMSNHALTRMKGMHRFPSLVELNLSENGIRAIEGIDKLANLERLNLSGNKVEKIPKSIVKNSRLKILILARNRLSSLKELENLSSLRHLSQIVLSSNPVSELPHVRPFVIALCRPLDALNGEKVTESEREAAVKRFSTTHQIVKDKDNEIETLKKHVSHLEQRDKKLNTIKQKKEAEIVELGFQLSKLQEDFDLKEKQLDRKTKEVIFTCNRLYELEQELALYKIDDSFSNDIVLDKASPVGDVLENAASIAHPRPFQQKLVRPSSDTPIRAASVQQGHIPTRILARKVPAPDSSQEHFTSGVVFSELYKLATHMESSMATLLLDCTRLKSKLDGTNAASDGESKAEREPETIIKNSLMEFKKLDGDVFVVDNQLQKLLRMFEEGRDLAANETRKKEKGMQTDGLDESHAGVLKEQVLCWQQKTEELEEQLRAEQEKLFVSENSTKSDMDADKARITKQAFEIQSLQQHLKSLEEWNHTLRETLEEKKKLDVTSVGQREILQNRIRSLEQQVKELSEVNSVLESRLLAECKRGLVHPEAVQETELGDPPANTVDEVQYSGEDLSNGTLDESATYVDQEVTRTVVDTEDNSLLISETENSVAGSDLDNHIFTTNVQGSRSLVNSASQTTAETSVEMIGETRRHTSEIRNEGEATDDMRNGNSNSRLFALEHRVDALEASGSNLTRPVEDVSPAFGHGQDDGKNRMIEQKFGKVVDSRPVTFPHLNAISPEIVRVVNSMSRAKVQAEVVTDIAQPDVNSIYGKSSSEKRQLESPQAMLIDAKVIPKGRPHVPHETSLWTEETKLTSPHYGAVKQEVGSVVWSPSHMFRNYTSPARNVPKVSPLWGDSTSPASTCTISRDMPEEHESSWIVAPRDAGPEATESRSTSAVDFRDNDVEGAPGTTESGLNSGFTNEEIGQYHHHKQLHTTVALSGPFSPYSTSWSPTYPHLYPHPHPHKPFSYDGTVLSLTPGIHDDQVYQFFSTRVQQERERRGVNASLSETR